MRLLDKGYTLDSAQFYSPFGHAHGIRDRGSGSEHLVNSVLLAIHDVARVVTRTLDDRRVQNAPKVEIVL